MSGGRCLFPNDVLIVSGTLTFGGTLQVLTNGATALAAGGTFTLFGAGTLPGNFAVVTGSPGAWREYYFNPTSGGLKVVSNSSTNLTAPVVGGTMTVARPGSHLGWILQTQTNGLTTGLDVNRFDLPGSTTITQAVINLDPVNPSVFYRLRHP